MIEDIFKGTKTLQRALDASWLENKAISDNIANVDTPGYKRKKVQFEQFLADAIDNKGTSRTTTNDRHIPLGSESLNSVTPEVMEDGSTSMRLDGNNVDIESEMAQMAKNNIQYNALIQKISGEFRKFRTAINEGRK